MYVARFRLKDDEDIYASLCIKFKIEFCAYPVTIYEKDGHIHTFVGGVISGIKKDAFVDALHRDTRIVSVDKHHDFLFVHAKHPAKARSEIKLFYDPQFIKTKPIRLDVTGWEEWEVACADRAHLNKLLMFARKFYHGKILSVKNEKIKTIASLNFAPALTENQIGALAQAFSGGYYSYPRERTLPQLAKLAKKSYSTFQEHLSKAENKLVAYFLQYR